MPAPSLSPAASAFLPLPFLLNALQFMYGTSLGAAMKGEDVFFLLSVVVCRCSGGGGGGGGGGVCVCVCVYARARVRVCARACVCVHARA